MMDSKLICACFFTDNIFLHEYRLHVTYHDDQQFTQDYRNVRAIQISVIECDKFIY